MNPRSIRLIDDAREDLYAGRRFYDNMQEGVGAWFWDSLIADMESLHVYAGVHTKQHGYYRLLAKRFPYAVYYQLDPDYITIIATLPLRRDPEWIAGQFEGRSSGY